MKIKQILLLAIALCSLSFASAQNQVSGKLSDAKDGNALIYVNCVLLKAQDSTFAYGTTTDDKGRFTFKSVAGGNYLLRVSYVGYETLWQNVTVGGNKELGKLQIHRSATALSTVTVTAKKPLYAVDGEKQMYNVTEDPSVQTGNASDVLQNAPGVEVDADGNITLRGTTSVEIWINDRPSHMNEEALKQYIKQLPANAIERVEVITNPSARYSSKGAVVNIVTSQNVKRNELLCVGVKGTTTPALSPWVSYVWANEKVDLNIYLSGNLGNHDMASDGTSTLFDDNGDTSRFQKWDNKSHMPFQGGYLGFNTNWKIDSTRNLSAWVGAYPYWDQNTYNKNFEYYEYRPTGRINMGYLDTTLNHGFSHGAYGGLWYEHRYDTTGRKLSITFNGNYWANSGYSDDTRDYYSATMMDFKRHTDASMWNGSGEFGVNYTLPLKHDITIEAGGELGMGYSYNNDKLDSMNASGGWDNMIYRTYVAQGMALEPSLYATAQKRWGGFTTKLGLRFEDDINSGMIEHNALGDQQRIDKSFPSWVPSIHLSYQTETFESYSLSYTLRSSHEDDMARLTLFRVYDDYSFTTGNPNLLLSYTHNLEAGFSKYIMKFGNVGLNAYWRANTNEIGTMTGATYDPVIGPYMVNYTYPVNIGSSHTEGIEANITYRPSAFFNVRFNASLFNYGYNYDDFKDNKLSYSFRVNLWTKLWKRLELFANGRYSSPRLGLYSLSNASKSIDFGVSSDFFERRMTVNLSVNDIFGWSEWGTNTTAPQYKTTGSNRFNSRFVSLGLTFRFGKIELESKARQGASDSPMSK